jgi:selenide,water dikinase
LESSRLPVFKDLVLIGGGHTHVSVLKAFGMHSVPGVRLSLVARDIDTPYSGMLPGLVAGHYDFDACHIDLGPLARFAGARLIRDEAVGVDPVARSILFRSRPPLEYDVLSINTGSTPTTEDVPGALEHVIPVKPISNFLARWKALETRILAHNRPIELVVVGGGAGGVEIALAALFRLRSMAGPGRSIGLALAHASDAILPTHPARARRKLERILLEEGVRLHAGFRASRVEPGVVISDDGRRLNADEILWVTRAGAPGWIRSSGLAVDEHGFLAVDATLRSTSHPEIFGAGDVAAVLPHPREKAGVFAVRQGRPLTENLRRALKGLTPLPFRPQKRFLTILSAGKRYAVAARGGIVAEGAWVWSLKDWIDRRFMQRFRTFPAMQDRAVPTRIRRRDLEGIATQGELREFAHSALRCAGCGAKVGAGILARVLGSITVPHYPGVVIGLDAADDAAVASVPEGKLLVQTIDAFRAIVEDPWIFGRIAAQHALSDIWAMGAEPWTALALATVPHGPERKVEALLRDLIAGANEVLKEAGAALVGGHTSEGAEVSLGFAIQGLVRPGDLLTKSALRAGDRWILTKPIGTGALFAAEMRLAAKGRWIEAAIESMLASNGAAARVFARHGVRAVTDVTGFGLVGHLAEMARPLGARITISLDRIPFLDGAIESSAAGYRSSLWPQNAKARAIVEESESASLDPRFPLLFDPQTSGGLLAAVPTERADACLAELRTGGLRDAEIIGFVESLGSGGGPRVSVRLGS